MTASCGTYGGYQRATRWRRLGKEHCGPCEKCMKAARSYNKTVKVKIRRAKSSKRRRREDPNVRLREHDKHLRHTYGITMAQKEAILRAQGDCCAVCKRNASGSSRGWFTDHNHDTDDVRGILCINCNTFIGHACKAVGSEDPGALCELLGARVLQYLADGAAFVKRVLNAQIAAADPEYMVPAAKPFMPTKRQFTALFELSDQEFRRCHGSKTGSKSDMLSALAARGLIERKLRDGVTRRGTKPKHYVYRRTPAGLDIVLALRQGFDVPLGCVG